MRARCIGGRLPLLGGLGIFIPFVLALLFFYKGMTNLNLKGVVISSFLIVLLGVLG